MTSLTSAVKQLTALSDGTPLTLTMDAGKIALAAPGMPAVVLTLPVAGGLVIDDDLRWQLENVLENVGEAAKEGAELEPSAWFFIASAFISAGESGVSF